MDLLSVVKPLLVKNEGRELHVYRDSLGIPTIGVGLALLEPDGNASRYAMSLCQRCGVDYGKVLSGEADLTSEQCDHLLNLCIIDCVEDLESIFPNWEAFGVNRQAALVDLRFNLGPERFRGFKKMIAALKLENYTTASLEAADSRWYNQVSEERGRGDVGMIDHG